jgi:hypothetical protein
MVVVYHNDPARRNSPGEASPPDRAGAKGALWLEFRKNGINVPGKWNSIVLGNILLLKYNMALS